MARLRQLRLASFLLVAFLALANYRDGLSAKTGGRPAAAALTQVDSRHRHPSGLLAVGRGVKLNDEPGIVGLDFIDHQHGNAA